MPYGFYGRLARIDLSTGRTSVQEVAEAEYRRYLGGSGLAFKLLLAEFDPAPEPFDPAAPLIFMGGLLTGFSAPTASRVAVVSRSPATGLWSEASAGGYWANMLAATGYDGLIITGRAEQPAYLWLTPDGLELRPADHLWGRQTYEVHEAVRAETDPRAEVACIGPAGERLVNLAGIMMGGHHTRAAGRGGLGAVMGAKNLKAVAIWGDRKLEAANARGLTESLRPSFPVIRDYTRMLYDYGTPGAIPTLEQSGDMPIKNWQDGNWPEGAARISGKHVAETILEGHQTCARCPIRCTKTVHVTKGPHAGGVAHQAEYETAAGFGALILNDDHEMIAAVNDLCNRLGIDTISTSSVCAWAYELYERGIIGPAGTGGLELTWGNGEALLGLVEQIGLRGEGLGELLGRGVRQAAEAVGQGTGEYAIHVKGLEMPYHDPRAFTSMAVVYATAVRGACHLEGLTYFAEGGAFPSAKIGLDQKWDRLSSEGKGELAKRMQDYMAALNALGLCKFVIRGQQGPGEVAQWVSHITGWEMTPAELMQAGERLFNLKRLAGVKTAGIDRRHDTLPPRLLTHARPTGGAAGVLPKLEPMLDEYYAARGWDAQGRISPETLEALGLEPLK